MSIFFKMAALSAVAFFAFVSHSAAPGSQTYTLSATRDYTHMAGPMGCPDCKDLFYTTVALSSPAGTQITSVEILDRRPHQNNHWYRCEKEVQCGVQEFSDATQHNKSCIGTSACIVWRATDSQSNQEDDIRLTWQ
jgi:hypothetical protein